MSKILIKNAIIVTMDENNTILNGDLLIEDSKISKIAENIEATNNIDRVIDANRNLFVFAFPTTFSGNLNII